MNNDDSTSTEDKDGLRYSWGVWPSTKIEVSKIVVPPACLYIFYLCNKIY